MCQYQSDSNGKRESPLRISNERISRWGIFYTGDRGAEKTKREEWSNPEADNNQECPLHDPLPERQGPASSETETRGWNLLLELISMRGLSRGSWNHRGDTAASGGTIQTERGRSSLVSPLLPPPTSTQWLPLGKASWHGSLGNSGCKGSKNPYLQGEDYLQNKVDNIAKKQKYALAQSPHFNLYQLTKLVFSFMFDSAVSTDV